MVAGAARTANGITVSIARDAALVRTVRLVAASFARRATTGEDFVEEVRLAVGEACALLVGPESDVPESDVPESDVPGSHVPESSVPETHVPGTSVPASGRSVAPLRPRGMVEVSMDLADRLRVVVQASGSVTVQDPPDGDIDGVEPWALLRGLIDDFEIHQDGRSTKLSMSWAVT